VPLFHWQGRDGDGRLLEGDLEAPQKDDVVARLRDGGVVATAVTASTATVPGGDLPPVAPRAPRGLAERLARERATGRPHRLRGLLIAAFFLAVALGVGAMGPVTAYRCERTAGGSVDCRVRQRPLGLFALREQRLAGVTAVDDENQTVARRDKFGQTLEGFRSRLVLRDSQGHSIPLTGWDEPSGSKADDIGQTEAEMRSALAGFLADSQPASITGWRGHSAPLPIAAVLLLLGLLMLALFVLSLFAKPTERIYAAVGRLAAAADARAAAVHAEGGREEEP
jgi:hypothetical protein